MYYEIQVLKHGHWTSYWLSDNKEEMIGLYTEIVLHGTDKDAVKLQSVTPPPETTPIAVLKYWEKKL
jgi:hypothetical protein